MPLIKNPKGTIVAVTAERKNYLLTPNPPALMADGTPKRNSNGKIATLVKAEHEFGWSDVTAEEEKEYNEQLEADQEDAENVSNANEAAGLMAVGAALAAKKAADADQKNATKSKGKGKGGRKSNEQKEQEKKDEMEKHVVDAEGDAEKYDALTDDERAMYLEKFEAAPEGATK